MTEPTTNEGRVLSLLQQSRHADALAILKSDRSLDLANDDVIRAFLFSVRDQHRDLIEQFLRLGVAPDATLNGECALLIASRRGAVWIVEKLIALGADVNARSRIDETPLTVACRFFGDAASCESYERVVRLLLEAGADANTTDVAGEGPISHACEKNLQPLVTLLLNAGASAHSVAGSGGSPLYVAARVGSLPIVSDLIAHGAEIDRV